MRVGGVGLCFEIYGSGFLKGSLESLRTPLNVLWQNVERAEEKNFGIRISGLGDRWFTAPVAVPQGLYFPGFTAEDSSGDIGDSTITETAGIGGFAMASAPAIVTFVSGTPRDALNATLEMYEICFSEHKYFTIPPLDFRGTPTGIDIRKVVEKGITPRINTGIAHKDAGVGQVGAGLVRPPMSLFEEALVAYAERYGY